MTSIGKDVRLGMIGCGLIAGVHADAARRTSGRVSFVACADKNEETARTWAAKYNCKNHYASIADMLRSEQLDGIVIATWPKQHHEHIYEVIAGGIRHILCEKALTINGETAAELLRRSRAAGATILEGFMFRHHPFYLKMKNMLPEIGKIDTVRAGFQEYDEEKEGLNDTSRNWRQVKEAGGGVAFDFTCYSVHACTDLADSIPVKVSFEGEIGRYGTLTRLHGHIRYENGVVALIHSSRRAVICKEVEVNSEHASLALPIAYGFTVPSFVKMRKRTGRSNVTLHDEFLSAPEIPGGHDDHISARLQLEHFADMIGGARPRIDLAETVVNMFTMDAILESVETGNTTPVRLPDDILSAWKTRPALAA